jgi:hypothetical protein
MGRTLPKSFLIQSKNSKGRRRAGDGSPSRFQARGQKICLQSCWSPSMPEFRNASAPRFAFRAGHPTDGFWLFQWKTLPVPARDEAWRFLSAQERVCLICRKEAFHRLPSLPSSRGLTPLGAPEWCWPKTLSTMPGSRPPSNGTSTASRSADYRVPGSQLHMNLRCIHTDAEYCS